LDKKFVEDEKGDDITPIWRYYGITVLHMAF
jgi:hypothetical protein